MNGFFVNDSKHDVNATVVGSLANQVQETLILNAVAIGDTVNHDSETINISNLGGRKNLLVKNTHNQSVNVSMVFYDSASFAAGVTVAVAVPNSASKIISATDIPQLLEPIQKIKVRLACTVAPTSGSANVYLEGVNI